MFSQPKQLMDSIVEKNVCLEAIRSLSHLLALDNFGNALRPLREPFIGRGDKPTDRCLESSGSGVRPPV